MPLAPVSPGLAPADNFARIIAAFQAINTLVGQVADLQVSNRAVKPALDALQDALTTLQQAEQTLDTRTAALPDEVAALQRAQATLSAALQTVEASALDETKARAGGFDRLASILGAAILGHANKPGDNPFLFTTSLTGLAAAAAPLPIDGIITTALGRVYRATGNQVVASRRTIWNENGRVHALRFAYQRFAAPSDPANDAIQCGVAFLGQNGTSMGEVVVKTDTHPVALSGMQVVSCRLPSQAGDPIALVPPAGWVEARPFLRSFGVDGTTDFILIAADDVTNAGTYSPDLTATDNRVTALETAVAALNPAATGTPNGLATLDSSGTVVQLPMLKSAFLEAAAQFVQGAGFVVDNAVGAQGDHTLAMDHTHNPYVVAGSAWLTFATTTLGLTAAQVASILTAIGSPAQRGGTVPPTIVYDLDVTTASVMRSARARFGTIANADMAAFYANFVGDQGSDSFFVVWGERYAPTGGALYQLLLAYLTSSSGPGLTQAAATAQLTTIWANAVNYRPSA